MTGLRVLHVITRLVVGGAQENTLATVAGLQARGHEVVLATGPADGPEGSLLPRAYAMGLAPVIIPALVRQPSPARDAVALVRLYGLMRRHRFDVVHTHTSKAGVLGRVAAGLAKIPTVVHTPHGHVFDGYFGTRATRLVVAVERACARRTDALIAISDPCRADHLRLGVGTPEQFVTIPSGIPSQGRGDRVDARRLLDAGPGELVLGCIGRLVPVKGQHLLLDAFARIAPRHPRARLVLVGDGPCRADLEARARRLHLDGIVRFTGLRDDAAALLAGFDLYAQPSLNEGMGRALAMAMTAGLPVVATQAPGPAELLGSSSDAGLLVPTGDTDALAGALDRLLADERLRARLGDGGRRRAGGFTTDLDMVEAIEGLYIRLAGVERGEDKEVGPWPAIT